KRNLGTYTKVTKYRVTNKLTGVYIEFPVVGDNNVDSENKGYWTSTQKGLGAQYGLVLEDNGTFEVIPTLDGWLFSKQWTLPVRLIEKKP
ncbi:MAG: hypothetical protein IIU03_05850, partial [Bacteroidales bacterium]|nr:hypothetical protein [Bacteroidales bacterium]